MSENRETPPPPSGDRSSLRTPRGVIDNGNGVPAVAVTPRRSQRIEDRRARNRPSQRQRGIEQISNTQESANTQRRRRGRRHSPITQESLTIVTPAAANWTEISQFDIDGWGALVDEEYRAADNGRIDLSIPGRPSPMISGALGHDHADDLPLIATIPLEALQDLDYGDTDHGRDLNMRTIKRAERTLIMVPEEAVVRTAGFVFTNWKWAQKPQTREELRDAAPPEMLLELAGVFRCHLLRVCTERKRRHESMPARRREQDQEQGGPCTICCDPIPRCVRATTQCGHDYCLDCLLGWLAESENGDCPMCRTTLDQAPQNEVTPYEFRDPMWPHLLMKNFLDAVNGWGNPRWPNPVGGSPTSNHSPGGH